MNKLLLLLSISLNIFATSSLYAQTKKSNVIVTVVDSLSKKPLEFATVGIYNIGDSVAFKYMLTNIKGRAEITSLNSGKYNLKIEYVGYIERNIHFSTESDKKSIDLGVVSMSQSNMEIGDISVVGELMPMVTKGDTVIYNAKYFNPAPNDYLEDLLDKMPGLEIKDGRIYYRGKLIRSLTVEGRPFFSNDQSVALQNLPAYAIKNVRVNKKKELGSFSGSDYDSDSYELNVSLKDSMKNGHIGNIMAGYGTEDKYRAKGFVGKFEKEKQYAFLGETNNTSNATSPTSFRDPLSPIMSVSRNMANTSRSVSPGIVRAATAGVEMTHDYDIGEEKHFLFSNNLSYKNFDSKSNEYSNKETYIPNAVMYDRRNSSQKSIMNQGTISSHSSYVRKKQGLHIIFTPNISYEKQKSTNTNSYYSDITGETASHNEGEGIDKFDNELITLSGNLTASKIWKKKRGIYLTAEASYNNIEYEKRANSQTKFFKNEELKELSNINQNITEKGDAISVNPKINYNEIIKFKDKSSLTFKMIYNPKFEQNISDRAAYDFNPETDRYDLIDATATGYINSKFIEHKVGFGVRYLIPRNILADLTLSMLSSNLSNNKLDIERERAGKRKWDSKFAPSLSVMKFIGMGGSIKLNYTTYSRQATVDQLQPIVDNSNPLFIKEGNIHLKPEFIHNIKLSLDNRMNGLSVDLVGTTINDKIVSKTNIDALGVRRMQYVNENGTYNLTANCYLYKQISSNSKFSLQNNFSSSLNKNIGYTNGERYTSRNIGVSDNLNIRYRTERVNTSVGLGARYSNSSYSINSIDKKSQWTNSVKANLNLRLPYLLTFITDFSYNYYIGFKNNNSPSAIWNMEIAKQFNNSKYVLSVKGYDILNQTKNLKISYGDDYMEERWNNNIKRYFMLHFSMKFGKFGD